MGTLRVAFLSGAVLELAATLGIALVAVTVGVRLVDGGIGYDAGARRAPARAGALPPAAHARSPVPRQRGWRRRRRAACSSSPSREPETETRPRRASLIRGLTARVRLEGVSYAYPGARRPRARRRGSRAPPGRDGRARRPEREREEHDRLDRPRARGSHRRAGAGGRDRARRPTTSRPGVASVAWVPQRATIFSGTVADNIRLGDAHADDAAVAPLPGSPAPTPSSTRFPTATRPEWGTGADLSSAGEAQRIALARAFAARRRARRPRRADGEPRSRECGGDRRRLQRLSVGRTVLVIAHRPELAQRAPTASSGSANGRVVDERDAVGAA